MPKVQDANHLPSLIDFIVNPHRCVKEAAHILALINCYTQMWKRSEDFGVVQKAFAKSRGGFGIVSPNAV